MFIEMPFLIIIYEECFALNIEEFKEKAKDSEWAPGWDEIEDAFKEIYGTQEPEHFGTIITSRAIFGGKEYLDGYSVYSSDKGYSHVVTFGMSELYADEESFDGEYSKWGYEMTIKLRQYRTKAVPKMRSQIFSQSA